MSILPQTAQTAPVLLPYVTNSQQSFNWMIIDIETAGRDGIEHLLETPEAAENIKDPEKIAADIAKKIAKRDSSLALDSCLNRIVAVTILTQEMTKPHTNIIQNEDEERTSLATVWNIMQPSYGDQRRAIIGFHVKGFDVPVLLQRTRLLGMAEPAIDAGRYSKQIIDLADILAFGDPRYEPGAQLMRRRLKNYCTLFGLPQDDADCDGADVPNLIAEGNYDAVRRHCDSDVLRTFELAKRLGVVA